MKRINIKCPYCNSQAFLRPASAVHGQEYRQPDEEVYVCARYPACDSYVRAHRRTRLPMAVTVIRNHLLDCCKAANAQQKHLCSLLVLPKNSTQFQLETAHTTASSPAVLVSRV